MDRNMGVVQLRAPGKAPGTWKVWIGVTFEDRLEIRYGLAHESFRKTTIANFRDTPYDELNRRARKKIGKGYEPIPEHDRFVRLPGLPRLTGNSKPEDRKTDSKKESGKIDWGRIDGPDWL